MSNSLRDQLLGLGYKPAAKPEVSPKPKPENRSVPKPAHGPSQRHVQKPQSGHRASNTGKPAGRTQEEIDLARAYALRAQTEKDERIAAEASRQEEARLKREAKTRLVELIKDRTLNVAEAEHVRHFEYGGKIRRIYVTPEQLKSLNRGELGVIQLNGHYSLVAAEVALAARAILASHVALLVDPDAPVADDPYSDLLYQVPDDLTW